MPAWLAWLFRGLGLAKDTAEAIRDARRANVEDALTATYSGQAASEAGKHAGHEHDPPPCK